METTLDLPVVSDQHAFNLERWEEICADPVLAAYEFRIETDRYGHPTMMPPPGIDHGAYQSTISFHLRRLLKGGKVLTECPVSTADGIKGVDVVWISTARIVEARRNNVLVRAPEICVEVISPSNTRDEIAEKKRLYFNAGADEVWLCDARGRMTFFCKANPGQGRASSALCSRFPVQLSE
ncbi:MAG: Uma2 family endonuclease [Verrucomicrobia bacterium]|nr:Uma2 family endonuclease [Verrucomicrobiota bacterium]